MYPRARALRHDRKADARLRGSTARVFAVQLHIYAHDAREFPPPHPCPSIPESDRSVSLECVYFTKKANCTNIASLLLRCTALLEYLRALAPHYEGVPSKSKGRAEKLLSA